MARMDMTLQEGFDTVRQKASDLAQIPQAYFMQVEQAYKDERQRQQEMQNIQEFGNPMGEPVEMPPAIEEQAINPVSMAGGGPAMSDNEPRFETRSPESQMFSIDANINNLMKSYNMLVDAKEFGRAQEVADQIDQLQQQKIAIQAQNVPMMQSGPLTDLSNKIGTMMGTLGAMGQSARTIPTPDRQIVENILQDISL